MLYLFIGKSTRFMQSAKYRLSNILTDCTHICVNNVFSVYQRILPDPLQFEVIRVEGRHQITLVFIDFE